MELSSSASFYTDNNDFFNGKQLEEDLIWSVRGISSTPSCQGCGWVPASDTAMAGNPPSTASRLNDRKGNLGWGLSAGIPVNRDFGFKIAYIGIRTDQQTGSDTDTLAVGCSLQW